jgi:protein-tyrosine phosphatase
VVPLGTRERDVSAVLAKHSGDAGVTPAMTKNVYWITAAQPHRVAIAARPRGGDWLEDDIKRFSTEGIGVLVSMLTPEESAELGLSDEGKFCDQCRISFFNLPIADRSVPNEFEIDTLLDTLVKQLQCGRGVGFHCRAGIGRSSMLAALVLGRLGWTADAAFRATSEARGCPVPDTLEQQQWVRRFVHKTT